ncbi:hypothetical protein D9757_001305 [Collybiopsis confluens]|uniref:Ubiquitin carboxyl-terminal hydrolase n=1 Tax=Collybiopsis confluens TaxID=2823264 RepID=A0A8H5I142_9AGAR|nr:hypothetical protein D9757_001305 [Collybiopsis confluens]
MLASPLFMTPQANPFSPQKSLSSDENQQYRPSKDIEAFNNLLPPPIEFVEGSSSDALAVTEGKYEPINATPKRITKAEKAASSEDKSSESRSLASSSKSSQPNPPSAKIKALFSGDIDLSWPHDARLGSGLFNGGNTCFLNSSLQCLVHTPPLLHLLRKHDPKNCRFLSLPLNLFKLRLFSGPSKNKFCMSCSLRAVAIQSHSSRTPFSPNAITSRLQVIAKHMRRGRQEDSHEFLRYAIDALQKSCLEGYPPKIDPKLAETTWIHKLFGGRLRSQVSCKSCGHNSDTFDGMLDLSLDIHHSQTLKDALRKFVAPDHLKGADKYKCEKCKKYVDAEKRFTIHEAPIVLTVHLKRFSPLGSKIGNLVTYDEQLSLEPYMSKGQYGPTYYLYGVICHAGGGPHSGHYYAFVKGKDNRWYEMNDDSVSSASPPTRNKNSYILFYLRNKGQKLESAMRISAPSGSPSSLSFTPTQIHKSGVAAQMQKKKRPRDDEVGAPSGQGPSTNKPFIGPLLPSQSESSESSPSQAKRPKLGDLDPQATVIKRKIASAKAQGSLPSLVGAYGSDEDEDVGEVAERPEETGSKLPNDQRKSPPPPRHSCPPPVSAASKVSGPIPPSTFYGTPSASKRKSFGLGPANRRMDRGNGYNPYTVTYGKKKKFRAF